MARISPGQTLLSPRARRDVVAHLGHTGAAEQRDHRDHRSCCVHGHLPAPALQRPCHGSLAARARSECRLEHTNAPLRHSGSRTGAASLTRCFAGGGSRGHEKPAFVGGSAPRVSVARGPGERSVVPREAGSRTSPGAGELANVGDLRAPVHEAPVSRGRARGSRIVGVTLEAVSRRFLNETPRPHPVHTHMHVNTVSLARELQKMEPDQWNGLLPMLRRVARSVAPGFRDVVSREDALGELALYTYDRWLADWSARVLRGEETRNLETFLCHRLRDHLRDLRRRDARRRRLLSPLAGGPAVETGPDGEGPVGAALFSNALPRPDEDLEAEELRDAASVDEQARALVLRRESGFSQQEIADALGVSRPTVSRRLAAVRRGAPDARRGDRALPAPRRRRRRARCPSDGFRCRGEARPAAPGGAGRVRAPHVLAVRRRGLPRRRAPRPHARSRSRARSPVRSPSSSSWSPTVGGPE